MHASHVSICTHSIITWFIFRAQARTGTPAWGEVAPRHSVYRLEKFLSKIQPTSRNPYKPSQRSSYMSIYQGAVIRTLERLSDVSDGVSVNTGDTISLSVSVSHCLIAASRSVFIRLSINFCSNQKRMPRRRLSNTTTYLLQALNSTLNSASLNFLSTSLHKH